QVKNFINNGTIVSDAPTTGLGISIEEKAPFDSSFINYGTIRTINGGIVGFGLMTPTTKLSWQNLGPIEINGGTFRAGGKWRQSNLVNYTRVGGNVQIGGKFTGNLRLNDQSGSWTLTGGGSLASNRVTRTGNNALS